MKCFIKTLLPLMAVFICLRCSNPTVNPIQPPREDNTSGDEPRSDVTTPGNEGDPQVPEGESLYVSAVLLKEDGSRNLALYKDGGQVFEIPCSEQTHISEDPDTHFLIGARLFTVFCDKSSTFICLDGEELYKINSREYIKSLLWDGQDIWTLGIPLDGDGFRVRRNAVEFFSKKDGTPLSFYKDGADLYLSFYTLLAGERVTYLLKNDNCVQIRGPRSKTVEDVRIHNGKTCYIERDGRTLLMSYDGQEYSLDCQAGFTYVNAEAIPYGQDDFTLVMHMKSNYSPMPADKIHNKDTTILAGAGTACYYYYDTASWWRLCLTKDADRWYVYNALTDSEISLDGIYIPSGRCVCVDEGVLYLAASYKDASLQPFVWSENKTLTYRIKGTLSGISISPPM